MMMPQCIPKYLIVGNFANIFQSNCYGKSSRRAAARMMHYLLVNARCQCLSTNARTLSSHWKRLLNPNLTMSNIFLTLDEAKNQYSIMISCFECATDNINSNIMEGDNHPLYYSIKNGNAPYPKKRDMYSLGIILFILIFSYKVHYNDGKGGIEEKDSFDWFSLKKQSTKKSTMCWDNRLNWKKLKCILKQRGHTSDESELLRDLINKLVTKIDTVGHSTQYIMQSEWLLYSQASYSDIKSYL
jgi:hypothetical protein